MINEAFWAVISLVITLGVFCYDTATWSHEGTCPRVGYVDGVTASGVYRCRIPLDCREFQTARGGWSSDCDGALEYTRRIFCGANERAVIDLRGIVRCQLKEH
jgi:hypothetical protein